MLLSSTLTFFPANSTEERKEQVRITRPNRSSWGCACEMRRGVWGRVMPNAAPDTRQYMYPEGPFRVAGCMEADLTEQLFLLTDLLKSQGDFTHSMEENNRMGKTRDLFQESL